MRTRDKFVMPSEVTARGSTTDLCEQFMLSTSMDTPDGWVTERIGDWRLARHPTLAVITLRAGGADDAAVGWILGYPITADGRLLDDGSTVALDTDPISLVEELGGRFLAIVATGDNPAIYPDATGSYSSVYCASLQIAASTPALIPYESTTTDRHELLGLIGVPWRNANFPFGMTPRHGVDRLLPNHHLDLRRWEMVRHGLGRRYARGELSVEETAGRVAAITRRQIAAIMDHTRCYLPLTAGSDSRMLLACARDRVSELALYTVEIPDLGGATDVDTAATVARRFGLAHQRIHMIRAGDADLDRWLYRTGCSVGEPRGLSATTTYHSLDRNRSRLNGQIGDFSRLVYRTPTDHEDTAITVERLALHGVVFCSGDAYRQQLTTSQLQAALSDEVLERSARWKQDVAEPDALRLLDLVYIENELAGWAGVWTYAEYFGPGYTIFPMCHSDIIALIMGLPEEVRRKGEFLREVIGQMWPELLDIPFNTPTPSVRRRYQPVRLKNGLRRRVRAISHVVHP